MHRKTLWLYEVAVFGAGPGRVQRRVFEEPDQFRCGSLGDRLNPGLHKTHGLRIGHQSGRNGPFYGVFGIGRGVGHQPA